MNSACDTFEEIVKEYESETSEAENKLSKAQTELQETERRLLRQQLQKQGKVLLKCKYNSKDVLGCLTDDKCKNCVANYSPDNNHV